MSEQSSPGGPQLVPPPPTVRQSPNAALPFFLCLAVLFVMAFGAWKWWQVRQFELARGDAISATAIGPPLSEFELTERSGQPFRSADMKGKVWVATYFFTSCPGNCIRLNQSIQLLSSQPDLKDVTWVSITCDPDNDSVDELRKYADRLNADPERWLFCRAPLEYTQRVAKGMNLALFRKGHQDYAVVVDKTGKIRGMFDAVSRSACEKMHALLVELQKEEPPHSIVAAGADEPNSS